jgi:hypothetical protein
LKAAAAATADIARYQNQLELGYFPARGGIAMKRTTALLVAVILFVASSAYAVSAGFPGGTWPKNWPKELEPLRGQAWTWEGGQLEVTSYAIPFANREEFESAWPHILSLKSKGAPLTLLRGPHFPVRTVKTASVVIYPPYGRDSGGHLSLTRITLVVDGELVDLNRIPLPADTTIIDERFKGSQN